MKEKCKPLLGQLIDGKLFLSNEEKLEIVNAFLSGNETKTSIYKRYTGHEEDHGRISKWIRQFGINESSKKSSSFVVMSKPKKSVDSGDVDFEKLQLEKRIAELEKQVQMAEMKAIAFSTMVDIAERQFNISIRKKYNTKL